MIGKATVIIAAGKGNFWGAKYSDLRHKTRLFNFLDFISVSVSVPSAIFSYLWDFGRCSRKCPIISRVR